ncbi:hypothetical protein [Aliiglaciecola litoralis]|uniref:SGNH/GDSL hydrolase family protein n=1 Tax=Aliiglaciecola litoralis TaxID=582857 RepID=A0ABN1LQW3_9ALTE
MKLKIVQLLIFLLLTGCNPAVDAPPNSKSTTVITAPSNTPLNATADNLPIPNNSENNQYAILFIGNSHVLGLSVILRELLQKGVPQKNLGQIVVNTGDYLADRLDDGRSLETLQNNDWSHAIFQAQKYSQSGSFEYPTTGAQTWIQYAKAQNTTPILFPEHPQRNNKIEGTMVHNLHVSIAKKQASCVAPVGLVWDRVIALRPNLALYQEDGNHASNLGRFLTALVFYEIISGQPADLLPYISNADADLIIQDFMGQIVTEVIAANPPCEY